MEGSTPVEGSTFGRPDAALLRDVEQRSAARLHGEICLLVQPEDLPGVTLRHSTQLHVDRVVQLALS